MKRFTAVSIVKFYQEVIGTSGGIEFLSDGEWEEIGHGPSLNSLSHVWRITPQIKIIDMEYFIVSDIDCEFSDGCTWYPSKLSAVGEGYYDHDGHRWDRCMPRTDHIHFHDGAMCPVPEGFELMVYFRNEGQIKTSMGHLLEWEHDGSELEIIGFEVLGLIDGWVYPWE